MFIYISTNLYAILINANFFTVFFQFFKFSQKLRLIEHILNKLKCSLY